MVALLNAGASCEINVVWETNRMSQGFGQTLQSHIVLLEIEAIPPFH